MLIAVSSTKTRAHFLCNLGYEQCIAFLCEILSNNYSRFYDHVDLALVNVFTDAERVISI